MDLQSLVFGLCLGFPLWPNVILSGALTYPPMSAPARPPVLNATRFVIAYAFALVFAAIVVGYNLDQSGNLSLGAAVFGVVRGASSDWVISLQLSLRRPIEVRVQAGLPALLQYLRCDKERASRARLGGRQSRAQTSRTPAKVRRWCSHGPNS